VISTHRARVVAAFAAMDDRVRHYEVVYQAEEAAP
jgi:hypothetical protein